MSQTNAFDDIAVDKKEDLDAWVASLLDRGQPDALEEALQSLSLEDVNREPSLQRLQAHAAYLKQDFPRAFSLIQRAQQLAIHQEAWRAAVYCALDEARWRQSREQYNAARLALDLARNLAEKIDHEHIRLQADLLLAIGRLLPDFSQNWDAIGYCERALHLYERLGDLPGQVHSLWMLSVINTYMAHLAEARAQIERALLLHRMAGMNIILRMYLLNVSAHIYLYAGQAKQGLDVIQQEAAPHLRQHPQCKPALYLTVVEGSLLWQIGRYEEALEAYDRAEVIVDALTVEGYRPWLALHRGWTRLLMGESPGQVRGTLLQAGSLQYGVMKRALNMYLAVLDLLENRLKDADVRLRKALVDFTESADLLEVFAVRIYQAWLYDRRRQYGELREALEKGLGWAEEAGIDFFPHYWHPQLVADVCVTALRVGVHSRQAELMIIRRLGGVAVPGLARLLQDESFAVRQRARSVLAALGDAMFNDILNDAPGPLLTDVLLEHVRMGRLRADRIQALSERLGGGDWVRLAVFGYYVGSDLTRQEMAQALALSEGAVKKHIAVIRGVCGIRSRGGRDRGRDEVRGLALEDGFMSLIRK